MGVGFARPVELCENRGRSTIVREYEMRVSVARFFLGVLALAAVAVACSSTPADDPSPGQGGSNPSGVVDDGGVGPAVALIDGSANDADAKSGCDELGALNASGLTASYDTASRWFTGALSGRPSLTQLTVVGVGTPSDLQGKVVALGAGLNDNYATCTHCMIVLVGCTATDCNSAKKFFAEAGSAYFNQVASGPGQPFVGQFTDVTLREITLDASFTSTDVPGGACLHLASFAFSAKTPANATDAGGSSDGGNATGSGGKGVGSVGTTDPPLVIRPSDAGVCVPESAACVTTGAPCCEPFSCVADVGTTQGTCL
jgi:hypothetical protein